MSADPELLQATRSGPSAYVEHIRRKVLRDGRRSIYASHNLQGLLKFVSSWQRDSSRDSHSPVRYQVDSFAWLYELRPNEPTLARSIPNPESLSAFDPVPPPQSTPHGDLLILRGYPSSPWLAYLGWHYGIEDEFWRQHLDFLDPSSNDTFPSPYLPSSSHSILRLRITTIGTRGKLDLVNDPTAVECLRNDASRAMTKYNENLRVGNGWRTGDSIVRDYTVFDLNHFSFDQRITIYLNRVDTQQKYWRAFIFTDCGEDLAASPHGPWLGDTRTRTVDRQTNLAPLHRYLQNGFETPDPWLPNAQHYSEHFVPEYAFTQTAGQMHMDYGQALDRDTMCANPFYAMSDVFMLVALAESKFLNLVAQKLHRDSADVMTNDDETGALTNGKTVFAQSNLVRSRQLLDAHMQDLRDILNFLYRQRKLGLWTGLELTEKRSFISESSLVSLEHDFQHLLQRAENLHQRCESAMVTALNSASIAEARRGLTQTRSLFRFTVLAALYVPLSFTSSFMGMNVTEIVDGSRHSIWLFFSITVPIFAISALFLFVDWRMTYRRLTNRISSWGGF